MSQGRLKNAFNSYTSAARFLGDTIRTEIDMIAPFKVMSSQSQGDQAALADLRRGLYELDRDSIRVEGKIELSLENDRLIPIPEFVEAATLLKSFLDGFGPLLADDVKRRIQFNVKDVLYELKQGLYAQRYPENVKAIEPPTKR